MSSKYRKSFVITAICIILFFLTISVVYVRRIKLLQNTNSQTIIVNSISITNTPFPSNTPTFSPTPTPDIYKGMKRDYFYITFYGWPDNDPPGNSIAFPKSRYPKAIHNEAGGIGTYQNPLTFASDPSKIPVGTVYYLPYLKKYIVMEDYCEGCIDNWSNGEKHIDIWMESSGNFEKELVKCQRKWTRKNVEVIVNPSQSLPINTSPLFNNSTGECKI